MILICKVDSHYIINRGITGAEAVTTAPSQLAETKVGTKKR